MYSLEVAEKVYRLTFSLSLAEHLQRCVPDQPLAIKRRTFTIGRYLAPGEKSASGIYAIVDTRKFKTLRLALLSGVADLLRSDSRVVHEAWLV